MAGSGRGGAGSAAARSEGPVNPEVLNGYVLGAIALFAVCLYVAVVATGIADLTRRRKLNARKKRLRSQSGIRRWRSLKKAPHS